MAIKKSKKAKRFEVIDTTSGFTSADISETKEHFEIVDHEYRDYSEDNNSNEDRLEYRKGYISSEDNIEERNYKFDVVSEERTKVVRTNHFVILLKFFIFVLIFCFAAFIAYKFIIVLVIFAFLGIIVGSGKK